MNEEDFKEFLKKHFKKHKGFFIFAGALIALCLVVLIKSLDYVKPPGW